MRMVYSYAYKCIVALEHQFWCWFDFNFVHCIRFLRYNFAWEPHMQSDLFIYTTRFDTVYNSFSLPPSAWKFFPLSQLWHWNHPKSYYYSLFRQHHGYKRIACNSGPPQFEIGGSSGRRMCFLPSFPEFHRTSPFTFAVWILVLYYRQDARQIWRSVQILGNGYGCPASSNSPTQRQNTLNGSL